MLGRKSSKSDPPPRPYGQRPPRFESVPPRRRVLVRKRQRVIPSLFPARLPPEAAEVDAMHLEVMRRLERKNLG
jgi:hypothetical protein